jgi:hypothetical protein
MVKQVIQIDKVANVPGTKKIAAVMTNKGRVFTVEQIRNFIDQGIGVVINDMNTGITTAVTKKGMDGIQSVRDDTKENNLDSLEEFEL